MRIAYVTTYDSADVHAWSGAGHHIMKALETAGCEIVPVGGLRKPGFVGHAARTAFHRLRGKAYQRDRDPALLRAYARQVGERLEQLDVDVVFSPGTIPIAKLETNLPVVFWTDAVFDSLVGYYPEFSNFCGTTLRDGHAMEQEALTRASLAIYASEWAAEEACQHYEVDPAKIRVVPFGANVEGVAAIEEVIATRSVDECNLLMIGVDWERKGGEIAAGVATELHKRGLECRLDVVGCELPAGLPPYVVGHGFVSKKTAAGRAKYEELLRGAHFLILPSRAECFGIVFAEASAFGLPSLATRTGGIPSAVRDGINGQTFPVTASPSAYADFIEKMMAVPDNYRSLAHSSFRECEERLNWRTSGERVRELIEEMVSSADR